MDRRFVTLAAATVAFVLAYLASDVFPVPRLFFEPVPGRWSWASSSPGVAIGLYGRILAAFAAASAAGLCAWAAARRPLSDQAVRLWTGWTVLAVALAAAFFVYSIGSRPVVPMPP